MSESQLKRFRKVTTEEHERFKRIVNNGRRGRPKKPANEKEHVHSIRFSDSFLEKLKLKAIKEGFTAWQTYAKKILAENLTLLT